MWFHIFCASQRQQQVGVELFGTSLDSSIEGENVENARRLEQRPHTAARASRVGNAILLVDVRINLMSAPCGRPTFIIKQYTGGQQGSAYRRHCCTALLDVSE